MEVNFISAQTLGNRAYKKGKQVVPDSLFYNLAFKKLVKSGVVQVVPRDAAAQKVQFARDIKAQQKAKAARLARKALQSAKGASSATPASSSASGSVQALPTPAKLIVAGAEPQDAPAVAHSEEG